jgi:hypothetical protein
MKFSFKKFKFKKTFFSFLLVIIAYIIIYLVFKPPTPDKPEQAPPA